MYFTSTAVRRVRHSWITALSASSVMSTAALAGSMRPNTIASSNPSTEQRMM
jgi:hypothetical protein